MVRVMPMQAPARHRHATPAARKPVPLLQWIARDSTLPVSRTVKLLRQNQISSRDVGICTDHLASESYTPNALILLIASAD